MSETNRTTTIAVAETTYGTTPVDSPNWFTLRPTANTLTETPSPLISTEIRADRQETGQVIGNTEVAGQITGELSEDSWDTWIAAACAAAWATDVVKIGVLTPSYTVEVHYVDIDKYIAYTGVRINQMTIDAQYGQFATITFDLMGKVSAVADTGGSLVGVSGSVSAAATTNPLAAVDVSSIKIGGSESTDLFPGYQIIVANNLRPNTDLRTRGASAQAYGKAQVSGTISRYFSDHDWYESMLANTAVDIDVTIALAGKSFQFDTPNSRILSGPPTIAGENQDIVPAYGFRAYRDAGLASPLAITRVTA